jgi:hypothetical protein
MSVGIASIPITRYYASYRPRLCWLRGVLADQSSSRIVFEHETLSMIDEILTLPRRRFKDLVANVSQQRDRTAHQTTKYRNDSRTP